MRLVQLSGPSGGPPLTFHPQMTVVGGLDDERRAQMVGALQALPAGADPGWDGLVEAHGVVLDLHRDNLRLLGLQHLVDVVVGAGDLPGGGDDAETGSAPTVAAAPAAQLEGLQLSHDLLAHGVAALKRTRIEFEEARLQAVEAIEEARADLDPFATTAFEQAAAQVRRAEDAEEGSPPKPEPGDIGSVDELEAVRDRLRAELAEMGGVDLEPVRQALHRAERTGGSSGDWDAVALRNLVADLGEAEAALVDLDARRRDEGLDPEDLVRRIEGARIQLERLETSSAPPRISDDDRIELERAHDAVVEADAKVSSSRIGGKAARQHLEEALETEREILTRMGFPTYSSFALAQSAPGPDPETRVELETARAELAELEATYGQILTEGAEGDERLEAEARLAALCDDAGALVDAEPDQLQRAVLALADQVDAEDERAVATSALRATLTACGVDFGDLDLTDDEVIEVARVWLGDMGELATRQAELERELDTVQARLLVVAPALARGEANAAPKARAQAEVEVAEARLARHRQASDRVAELCGLLEEIEARLVDLGDNINAQESLVAAAAEGMTVTAEQLAGGDAPALDGPGVLDERLLGIPEGVDDTEWYLLTRLAGLSSVSYAGSVPLVLDGTFSELDRESAHRALDKVEAMTDVVQVIYLGDDDAVVEWAALRSDGAAVISASAPVG